MCVILNTLKTIILNIQNDNFYFYDFYNQVNNKEKSSGNSSGIPYIYYIK